MKLNSVQELVEILEVLDSLGYPVPFVNYYTQLEKHGFTQHISRYDMRIVHQTVPNDVISLVFTSAKEHLRYSLDLEKGLV